MSWIIWESYKFLRNFEEKKLMVSFVPFSYEKIESYPSSLFISRIKNYQLIFVCFDISEKDLIYFSESNWEYKINNDIDNRWEWIFVKRIPTII